MRDLAKVVAMLCRGAISSRGARAVLAAVRLGFCLALAACLAAETAPAEPQEPVRLVARDPAGHGLLCESQGKTVLLVAGTPEEMGRAHGALLQQKVRRLMERAVYLVGAGDTLQSGTWYFDRMAEIERRTLPNTPERFLRECDALSAAAGVSKRDGRYGNLLPERFHCSGVAVRGKASAGGRVIHARVLDYMRDFNLQQCALVAVFMPQGRNAWITLSYAGFVGTVTAMNDQGLAVGEMGGGGDGQWDGMPMSYLLRDLMERASSVEEALDILRRTPRTCEYYYVLSDRSKNLAAVRATAAELTVLGPGEQHPELPLVPEDTVLISGPGRAKALSQRLQQWYGQITVPGMMQIIRRPVAMESNLHDAIFTPETLDLWAADAGKHTVACDERYAHFNLEALMGYYQRVMGEK